MQKLWPWHPLAFKKPSTLKPVSRFLLFNSLYNLQTIFWGFSCLPVYIAVKYPRGRCFIRPSGTEDVIRVYAEASTQNAADSLANSVAKLVDQFLGFGSSRWSATSFFKPKLTELLNRWGFMVAYRLLLFLLWMRWLEPVNVERCLTWFGHEWFIDF